MAKEGINGRLFVRIVEINCRGPLDGSRRIALLSENERDESRVVLINPNDIDRLVVGLQEAKKKIQAMEGAPIDGGFATS